MTTERRYFTLNNPERPAPKTARQKSERIRRILWIVAVLAALLAVLCIARHHANISRLIHGTENKLGRKVPPQSEETK